MKRKTNRALLFVRLQQGYIERTKPEIEKKPNTSHMQGMAQLFAEELHALARGAGECKKHPDRVDGACPICKGLWPEP